jgi:hypothetical protein
MGYFFLFGSATFRHNYFVQPPNAVIDVPLLAVLTSDDLLHFHAHACQIDICAPVLA